MDATLVTTGCPAFDDVIDGVRTGDNLVVIGETDAPLELFTRSFMAAARDAGVAVVIGAASQPMIAAAPPDATLFDWRSLSSDGQQVAKAMGDQLIQAEPAGAATAYVIDDLASIAALHGADAALGLFLATCPRLYRRGSLALWTVRADAVPAGFIRRLTAITQVVVTCDRDDSLTHADEHHDAHLPPQVIDPAPGDTWLLRVGKADGRDPSVVGGSLVARRQDDTLVALGGPDRPLAPLGAAIRARRVQVGRSQAALAREVGISPSALSQIERGGRRPAAETLVALWRALDVPFGPSENNHPGYRLLHRGGRTVMPLADGMTGERIIDAEGVVTTWRIVVDPGASSVNPPFAVKWTETIVVLSGVFELKLGAQRAMLQDADAMVVTDASITGWSNPGPQVAELLWSLHPG